MDLDLRNVTFEQFVRVVFDHYPEDDVDDKWFWKEDYDVQIDARLFVDHLTQVCLRSADVLAPFTVRQVCEGLEFVFCGPDASSRLEQLWSSHVPWQERRGCILAIPQLYHQVFERHDDAWCGFMLWDWIAYGYGSGTKTPDRDPEDARVQDAMFEALRGMLDSSHTETQAAAIHGLGHLHHRESSQLISSFLSSDRTIAPSVRSYAGSVLEGDFQ
jgi:hypothetical protein